MILFSILLYFNFFNYIDDNSLKYSFLLLYKKNKEKALHIPCIIPTNKIDQLNISSLFGYRKHPKLGSIKHHDGIDIAVHNAPVLSTANGVIKRTGYSNGYGNFVEIDHLNGFFTLYGHLDAIFVEVGQVVPIAYTIGISGSTGLVTGEHIHYEIKYKEEKLNPLFYLLLLYDTLSSTH